MCEDVESTQMNACAEENHGGGAETSSGQKEASNQLPKCRDNET